jgi:hypothetical protein
MERRTTATIAIALAVLVLVTCGRDYSNFGAPGDTDTCVGLTSIQPQSGSNAEAVEVVIQGTNFSSLAPPTALLGPHALTAVTVLTPTLVTAQVPADIPAGTLDLIVITQDQCTSTLPMAYTAIDPGEIEVTSISPAEGYNDVATAVTITGANFVEDVTAALIGETPLDLVVWVSSTQLTAVVPLGLDPDAYDITVRNVIGETTTTDVLAEGFEVIESGKLYVSEITPAAGPENEDVAVTIRGRNFDQTPRVYLTAGGDVAGELREVAFVNARTLTATVAAGQFPDLYDLRVENPDSETYTMEDAYTVTEASGDDTSDDDTGSDDTADDDTADDDTGSDDDTSGGDDTGGA